MWSFKNNTIKQQVGEATRQYQHILQAHFALMLDHKHVCELEEDKTPEC